MKMLVLLLALVGMVPCLADFPVSKDDLIGIYGAPVHSEGDENIKLHCDGMDIKVYWFLSMPPVRINKICYERSTAFSESEIEPFLKPISGGETWTKKDNKTWVLPQAKVTARWDGESGVTVTLGVPSK